MVISVGTFQPLTSQYLYFDINAYQSRLKRAFRASPVSSEPSPSPTGRWTVQWDGDAALIEGGGESITISRARLTSLEFLSRTNASLIVVSTNFSHSC